ncbi:hypothetical protein GJU43_08080 [Flavobacterium sp. LC2016-23]|uniref:hypothetical protein n=1 Tax=Flavobacterium sp. LC2016-23 TaxID=2666330 RepID=UPI0012AF82D4|nr:hypothetical protein [Flavobacterium sp. LC2016-23]MRX39229.1 hypothetical protein [Flavobacterium sp. LC2016-23]
MDKNPKANSTTIIEIPTSLILETRCSKFFLNDNKAGTKNKFIKILNGKIQLETPAGPPCERNIETETGIR